MLGASILILTLTSSPVMAWNDPPPPPPMDHVRARHGWVWVEGGFDWRRGRYRRLPGHWERERPDHHWHSGRWDWRADHYEWAPGYWTEGSAYAAPPESIRQEVPPPPPPPRALPPPPQPRAGFVWIPGTQEWRGGQYVWVEGHWEREHSGDDWNYGHWDHDGDHYAWHRSGWRHADQDQDRDGPPPGPRFSGLSIMGRVVDPGGRPIPGITMVLAGTSESRVATDGDGRYMFSGLAPGSYAVRPTEPRCGFGPDVMNLNDLSSNAVQNFTANCR